MATLPVVTVTVRERPLVIACVRLLLELGLERVARRLMPRCYEVTA